jgi:hypothetical protein
MPKPPPMPERVEVRNTFATPVIMAMLPDHEKLDARLKKTILAREKKKPPPQGYDSNIGGWHSSRDYHKWGGKAGEQVFAPIGTERFVGWRPFGVSQRAKLTFRGGDELLFRVGRLQVVGHIEP